MKKLGMVLVAFLSLLCIPAMAAAQKMTTGKWTGSVVTPTGERTEVTYDVTMKGDTVAIRATPPQGGDFPFNNVVLKDRTLTFWFTPGLRVECTLTRREDESYEGPCKDTNGGDARMLMVPPKKS